MKTMQFFLVGISFFGTFAQASSIVCSDLTGQRLKYSRSAPDGGAHIAPTEKLTLDGEVLISKQPHGPDTDVVKAWISVGDKPKNKLLETKSPNWVSTAFVAIADVRAMAGDEEPQQILFNGFVTCETKKYVGVPIP